MFRKNKRKSVTLKIRFKQNREIIYIFAPMKKILVIDNYDSFVYNLVQLLREAEEAPAFEVVRNDAVDFGRLGDFGGVLLSPGPGVPEEAGDLLRVVERCRGTHAVLGVCLGLQAIAEAFGGRLKRLEAPLHGHRSVLRRVGGDDPLFAGVPEGMAVGRYHSWVVDERSLPAELKVGTVDEEGHVMSLYHRELPICGVQFHPESCISEGGARLLANWLRMVPEVR